MLFALITLAGLQLGAQTPRNIEIKGAQQMRVAPCDQNDAGTISFGPLIGQSNDVGQEVTYLCMGDMIPVIHEGGTLDGDPNQGTPPGFGYSFYDCRPTIDGPDLNTILTDPCLNTTNPLVFEGSVFPQTQGIWVASDNINGNITLLNNGFHQEAFNMGVPEPIQLWFAPITMDNFAQQGYENGGPCVSASIDQAFSVVYLEAIEMTESFPNAGAGLQGAFVLEGGLPEFDNNTSSYTISLSHISGNGLTGTVQTPGPGHGDTIQYTVPRPGQYELVVEDGKSCGLVDTLEVPVIFSAETVNGAPGSTVCVDIRVDNFTDVAAAQFTLTWDPTVIDFTEVTNFNNGLPALNESVFNTDPAFTGSGRLTFGWADLLGNGNTLPDGSVLFEACFEVVGQLGETSPVNFSSDPLQIQVGNPNNDPMFYPFELVPGQVNVTNAVLLVETSQDSVSCSGLSDGSFTVSVSGGAAPYIFTWNTEPVSGPETGPETIATSGGSFTVSNLSAGEYRVIVTDSDMPANIDTAFVEVFQGPSLGVNLLTTQPTCFGESDGSVTAQITLGGVVQPNPGASFTFTWNTTPDNFQTLDSVPSGFYQVTVMDQAGCMASASTTLSQPAQLQILANNTFITDATCSGSMDGSISVTATGGSTADGNYTYNWSNNLGTIIANSSQASGLNPGEYVVTVTDDNNCTVVQNFTVGASKILGITLLNQQDISCNGADDGALEVSGTSTGAPPVLPFVYSWTRIPGGQAFTGAQLNNLGPGQYVLTLSDSDPIGCSTVDTFTLIEPAPLQIQQVELRNESCENGGGDGSITIAVTGGTFPYTYNWPDGQADSIATNLSAGQYTVNVEDANNCTADTTFTITAPTPPAIVELENDTLACPGDSDGVLTVVATPGGAPIVSYEWSNNASGESISGLSPGSYFVTVTAQDGCFSLDTALVVAPEPLVLDSIVSTSPNCPGDANGSLTVYASGGTLPYTYIWNNDPVDDTLQFNLYPGLAAGNYEVTVVDANGCSPINALGTVEDPPNITISFSDTVGVSCFEGTCDGGATASAMYSDGSTGVFTFSWESGELVNDVMSSSATGLCKDWQTVVVTDEQGCFSIDSVFIPSPEDISIGTDISNVSCNGLNDGSVTVTPSGGTPGYTFFWQETGETTATIENLAAGAYTVEVADANGCPKPLEVEVSEPDSLILSVDEQNTRDVTCFGDENGVLAVRYNTNDMINQVGATPYTWSANVPLGSAAPSSPVASNLPAGTYSVTITDVEGCQDSLSFTISEPEEIVAVVPDPEDPLCFNSTTKVFIDTIYGGAGTMLSDYQYMVDGNGILLAPTMPADIFGDGIHIVEVFDPNGCSTAVEVEIDQPEEIRVTFPEPILEVELGDTSTQLQPIITPVSTQVDSFIWTPQDYLSDPTVRNPFVRPLESLEYELMVVDVNGCEGVGTVFVELDANRNIYIPNAFSPNGDGRNDEFRVFPCIGVTNITSASLFDRWGNQVFQSGDNDVSNGLFCAGGLPLWDGTFRGNDAKPGVYVYVIEVEFLDNVRLVYRGDVSLLR